jgi:hypothetical protein
VDSFHLEIFTLIFIFISNQIIKIMAKSTNTPQPKYRDAGNGEYITKKQADANPKTTVKETSKPAPKKGK